ncbi:hypothetical protein IQ251_19080 [Saccharopolyspora sp. HNM0983]|uniref:Uncharacterized protein n=1 Tax=Saccharopolyspora montiporae TaxID=2781240 RepID=A0A929BAY1_9PSEU|nr:hypothetical protein [Saccharopolyspora sp. HNM0983]MBE9376559.1 hypothetical protein [Saccharopolyspora sp. HNM0983]
MTRDGHYASCERAESHNCACGVCGGAWHGWTGAVEIARNPDPQPRRALRQTADDRWNKAFAKCKTPGRATLPKKAASMDSVIADLVDLLSDDDGRNRDGTWRPHHDDLASSSPAERGLPLPRHTRGSHTQPMPQGRKPDHNFSVDELRTIMESGSTLDQVDALGTKVFQQAFDDIAEQFGGTVPIEVKKALADHFWCDFLANSAKYLSKGITIAKLLPKRVSDWISKRIIKWRQDQDRLPLEDEIIRTGTRSICKLLLDITNKVDLRTALLVVRILAILTCKSPERHQAVSKHCVAPISKHLTAETRRRLTQVIEQEWLPAVQGDAAQTLR